MTIGGNSARNYIIMHCVQMYSVSKFYVLYTILILMYLMKKKYHYTMTIYLSTLSHPMFHWLDNSQQCTYRMYWPIDRFALRRSLTSVIHGDIDGTMGQCPL